MWLSPTGEGLRVQKGLNSGSPASQRGLNLLLRKLQRRVCHGWRYKPLDAFANSALDFCLKVPLFFFFHNLPYKVFVQNIPFLPSEGRGSLVGAVALATPCFWFWLLPSALSGRLSSDSHYGFL